MPTHLHVIAGRPVSESEPRGDRRLIEREPDSHDTVMHEFAQRFSFLLSLIVAALIALVAIGMARAAAWMWGLA
jgi:hypothetical protein